MPSLDREIQCLSLPFPWPPPWTLSVFQLGHVLLQLVNFREDLLVFVLHTGRKVILLLSQLVHGPLNLDHHLLDHRNHLDRVRILRRHYFDHGVIRVQPTIDHSRWNLPLRTMRPLGVQIGVNLSRFNPPAERGFGDLQLSSSFL